MTEAVAATTQRPNSFGRILRAIGLLHRPTYPDGLANTPAGPLSKDFSTWSPFNVGFQLDLVYNQLIRAAAAGDTSTGCAGRASVLDPAGTPDGGLALARNGVQIFPGGVPIYRGSTLVGAIGISGDGIDQDDMISFLGLDKAGRQLGTIGNAPAAIRSDRIEVDLGNARVRLRYVGCPFAPFLDSAEQNVCEGL